MVTKLAGIILAAAATIPYTAATFSVSLAASLIIGTCAMALVTAHIFATIKKAFITNCLNEYASLIGMEWNEANHNTIWG